MFTLEPIQRKNYTEGIIILLGLARSGDGSGASVAAQVLLSAYNGLDYQLDISALPLLDPWHYEAALKVIRGRVELGLEPHELVENGGKIFEQLHKDWRHIHVKERGKIRCRKCEGHGVVYSDLEDDGTGTTCQNCRGKGRYHED